MPADFELVTRLGIYLTIIVVAVCVSGTIIWSIAFWRGGTGQANTLGLLLQRSQALQMATVILIILGACVLRIINSISSEAVVSILSGVAGYVLGGKTLVPDKKNEEESS